MIRSLILAGLVGLAVLGAPAQPASAHAALVSTTPRANTVLPRLPDQVVVTFSEPIGVVAARTRVIAPDGSRADSPPARTSGAVLIMPLRTNTERGTYLVTYRVISADSHSVGGAFSFSVGVSSPVGPPQEATPATSPVVAILFPIARWLGYLGLLLMAGTALFRGALWPRRLERTQARRILGIGAALVGLATVAELVLQVPNVAGGFGYIDWDSFQEALATPYGSAHLVRLGALVAALPLLRLLIQGRSWGSDRGANAAELADIVPEWSQWAFYAVTALITTGLIQAVVAVGALSELWTTTYGRLLTVKVLFVAGVLAVASFSRRQVVLIATVSDQTNAVHAAARLRRFDIDQSTVTADVAISRQAGS